MAGDLTLHVQPKPGRKVAPVWSENLGLPEVQSGLDRVAIAANIPTLAKWMERALVPADFDVYAEALEALDQVYADPVQRDALVPAGGILEIDRRPPCLVRSNS